MTNLFAAVCFADSLKVVLSVSLLLINFVVGLYRVNVIHKYTEHSGWKPSPNSYIYSIQMNYLSVYDAKEDQKGKKLKYCFCLDFKLVSLEVLQ